MTDRGWPLSAGAARVFYNLADAWIPARDGAPGGGDVDVVAALGRHLSDERARRRLERTLRLLEWSPRFALRSRSGFSWWPRAQRRAWLERWSRRGPAVVRRAVAEACGLAELAFASSCPGRAGAAAAHSLPGA